MEEAQAKSNNGTEFNRLRSAGADVRLDGNSRNMHHKVLIIDEQIVMFGSYNFSYYAETRNDENLIIMHHPQTAALFMEEFDAVYDQAKP
jgi:phosphatidylserine/phosphatidylglycerophosphate/cardiolipin synthase-like enzyme